MCKLSNFYVIDLFSNTTTGSIEWNVANATPKLMNNPCKIMVKQLTTELKDGTVDISDEFNLRVIHNMNIQSGSNNGSSNSNVLAFIDSFQARNYISTTHTLGFTTADCKLYAPNGLPNILLLNRVSELGVVDNFALKWAVRLEITVNPDDE